MWAVYLCFNVRNLHPSCSQFGLTLELIIVTGSFNIWLLLFIYKKKKISGRIQAVVILLGKLRDMRNSVKFATREKFRIIVRLLNGILHNHDALLFSLNFSYCNKCIFFMLSANSVFTGHVHEMQWFLREWNCANTNGWLPIKDMKLLSWIQWLVYLPKRLITKRKPLKPLIYFTITQLSTLM